MFAHFQLNTKGHDYVVGDIHGCFKLLEEELYNIGFDTSADRLFSVGDLVDRGNESEKAVEYLAKSWFHAVRGNHEQMAIDCANNYYDERTYIYNGGKWFLNLAIEERKQIADVFKKLPIAMDIVTENGLVGVVHADCPTASWEELEIALDSENVEGFITLCIWNRDRINYKAKHGVKGICKLIVGHTPVTIVQSLGNVHYIDTGAVFGKKLTIMRI
jgi:serine/threonine protein phosphatase 1